MPIPVQLRRFIPVGEISEGPDLYEFVGNSPENRFDPFGLSGNTTGKGAGHGTPCKTDCAQAETDCNAAVVVGCGIVGFTPVVGPVLAIACGAAGLEFCHSMEKKCEAANKANGFD